MYNFKYIYIYMYRESVYDLYIYIDVYIYIYVYLLHRKWEFPKIKDLIQTPNSRALIIRTETQKGPPICRNSVCVSSWSTRTLKLRTGLTTWRFNARSRGKRTN